MGAQQLLQKHAAQHAVFLTRHSVEKLEIRIMNLATIRAASSKC